MQIINGTFGKQPEETKKTPIKQLIEELWPDLGVPEGATGDFILIAIPDGTDLVDTMTTCTPLETVGYLEVMKHNVMNGGC